jgi:zinc/manganese transport system substrate-binding protein
MRRRMAVWLVVAVSFVAACGGEGEGPVAGSLQIVATTSVIGDLVAGVAGDGARVEVLVPVGADPHEFQASSRQAATVQEADLVVAVGLGLEEGLADVLDAAVGDGVTVLEIGPNVDPLPFGAHREDDHDDDDSEDHAGEDTDLDPHVWMDPVRMADAARLVGTSLAAIDPSVDWEARAAAYAAELEAVDGEIARLVATIPEAARKLVTNHDALGYFAARYGFDVIGVIVPGGSTLGDPSSADLAALVDVVRGEEVPAIFAETIEPASLADAVAAEIGGQVEVVELYTGSLGEPGTGAETLIGLLLTDALLIVEALS